MNTVPNKRFTHAAALSLKQLSYLLAVSQTLNFTRAADLCCVTQSTLSSGLAELERLLGVQLVERDRQRVALTPIGLNMVERAQTLLAASEDLLNVAANACAPNAGHLSLGMIPTIAPFMLSKMLSHCRTQFPELQLSIREAQTHMLLEHVHQGELDAAIIATPMDLGKLESMSLFEEQLSLIAHLADPICQQASTSVELLPTERLLLLEEGHCLRDHTLAACPNHPKNTKVSSIQAATLNTMVQLVEAGMGYAMLPDMAITQGMLAHTHVKVIPLTSPAPTRTITLVTRASHPRLSFLQHKLAPEIICATKPKAVDTINSVHYSDRKASTGDI